MNDDVRARVEALERRQALLGQEMAGLDEALAELRSRLRVARPPVSAPDLPVAPLIPPPVPPAAPPVPPPLPADTGQGRGGIPPGVSAISQQPRPGVPEAPEPSLEMRVGTVWLARIGIVIVLTGLVFLANYAWKSLVENFGAIAKLGLLYLAGGTLCAVGLLVERGRESLRNYAGVLIAGGLAAIYYTTYAAYYVPSLKAIGSPLIAGLLLVGIAGAIGWMADRRNSQPTAGLAIALAFYASAVNPIAYFTLSSNAILGVAAVALMARKRWMAVPFLALAATYWSYLYWRLAESWRFWEVSVPGDSDLAVRLGFLAVYWVVFTVGAFVATGPKAPGATRVVFSTLNDAAFFCLAAPAISLAHHDRLWIVSLVFGLAQLALALAARKVHGPGTPLGSAWLAKALFFLTLAILIRFTGDSLVIILAVECSLLVFAARRIPSGVLPASGPLAGMLAALAGMASLSGSGTAWPAALAAVLLAANAWFCGGRPEITIRSLSLALCGVALGFAILMDRLPGPWEGAGVAFLGLLLVAGLPLHKCRELALAGMLASAGSTLVQFAMLESAGRWPALVALGLLAATAVTGPLISGGDKLIRIPGGILAIAATLLFWAWVNIDIPESHRFWLVALAATISLGLSREKPLRQAIAVILAVAAVLVFFANGIGPGARYTPWNFFGCVLLLGQERLARAVRAPDALARFAGIGGLIALLAWVTSAVRFFRDPLPLTAAWAILALAVFFAGFLLRARILRLGGLGILALALFRIAFFDVWKLDPPFRILSFLVLGSVLLLLGYLYNRHADRIRQWL
ncbi:MAG: DUF2339 domain-containing protein [Terrimicrobiaceae bacterium]